MGDKANKVIEIHSKSFKYPDHPLLTIGVLVILYFLFFLCAMSWTSNYRNPELQPLEGESSETLVRTITQMVAQGDLEASKFNLVLGQVRQTHNQALAIVENKVENTIVKPAKIVDIMTPAKQKHLVQVLEGRFRANPHRHEGVEWDLVNDRLKAADIEKWFSLWRMEKTKGDPDVFRYDFRKGRTMFFDFSPESPEGRRNLSYKGAQALASDMGVKMATEDLYMAVLGVNPMDYNTENWIKTTVLARLKGKARVATGVWHNCQGKKIWNADKHQPPGNEIEILWGKMNEHFRDRGFRSYLVI
jgi:hypothetical protein